MDTPNELTPEEVAQLRAALLGPMHGIKRLLDLNDEARRIIEEQKKEGTK